MKNIGLVTVFKGYNFGSSLQAFSILIILKKLNFNGVIFTPKGSLLKGRDFRLRKVFFLLLRGFLKPRLLINSLQKYSESISYPIRNKTKVQFTKFQDIYLRPVSISYKHIKRIANTNEYFKFLVGSDQVWNSEALYIDPFYYLRFAPKSKRISFSASFGRDFIPKYNQKIIASYLKEFSFITVREKSASLIFDKLSHNNVPTPVRILDPTLLISKEKWKILFNLNKFNHKENFILLYFLSIPNEILINKIVSFAKKNKFKIIVIRNDILRNKFNSTFVDAGPIEFLSLVMQSEFVFTDSFHGTSFSINFNKQFLTFSRSDLGSTKQETRISSLLEELGLLKRLNNFDFDNMTSIIFDKINKVLSYERTFSLKLFKEILNEKN